MKALFSRALLWTLTLAGISWPPALAHAQVRYGSIVVEARDPSGSAVPGADVTITETGTNRSRSGVTNSAGVVTFATIPPGTYSVRVNLTGFKEFVTTDVAVTEDTVMRVSSQLEVGQITETMTVSAAAAILQTDRAEVRTDIPAVQLENLPVPVGRNYQNLFVTVPGISPPENMHSVAVNPARGLAFSSNGTTRNANSIRIEGAISNNLWLPHVAAYVPALEAIESVGVTTSTFDADQGLSGGMSANVLIKSGTNVVSRLRVRVLLRRGAQVAALLPAGHRKEARGQPAPVRRHARRSDPPQQGVLLRQLSGHLRSAGGQPLRDGADRRDAQRGLLGVADADLRSRHRRGQRQRPHGVPRQHHPARALRSDRAEAHRRSAAPESSRSRRQLLRHRGLHLRSAQRGRQGELQPDRQAGDRGSDRVARLRVPQPADVRRSGRSAGQLDRGQSRHRPGRHLHVHGQRVARRLADVPDRRLSGCHDDRSHVGARSNRRESRLRLSGHSRHQRHESPLRRLAPLQHHQLLEHRLRGQQPLALHRRQLAGAVHRQRDLDEGGAHAEVRRRHRPSGDEPPRARRRVRQLHLRRRADPDPGRARRESVQHHRGVPARLADRHLEERDSLRERLHAEPQLAVQLLRARPVAADTEADGVARLALRQVSDGHAHHPRTRALRSRTRTRC